MERARYEADRAEHAFHACEPETGLVARSLEQHWEAKLRALAEAQGALAASQAEVAPLPARDELEVRAVDLPRPVERSHHLGQGSEATSANSHRRRHADFPIGPRAATKFTSASGGVRPTTEEIVAARPAPFSSVTSVEAVELIKRLAGHTDHEIAAELNGAGLRTGAHGSCSM